MSNNKIALITGGSRGLGKNMALALAKNGTDLIITYRKGNAEANETVRELEALGRKAVAIRLDLSEANAVDNFIVELQSILTQNWNSQKFDILVNNAGMGATVPFEEVTEKLFDEFLHVHFKGVYFLTQKCLPLLNAGGRILNISTGTTRFANPGYSVYASMKGAVETLTKYLAKELGSKGITANVLAPGPVETDFNNAAIRSNPVLKERLSSLSPLGRVGVADDIGPVVAFLCSPEAGWINGQRLEVSGGILV
jgi:NAD(P)-dependent dehydrogenase (short-subunit alcohol dehydrogenase family)